MRKYLVGGICCLCLAGPGGVRVALGQDARPAAAGAATRTMVVRKGDDCQAIVRRVYDGAPGAMARFHAANPQLGGLPHQLTPGDVVNIPPLWRNKPERAPRPDRPDRGDARRASPEELP